MAGSTKESDIRLLTAAEIDGFVNAQEPDRLSIRHFSADCLQHSSYYFRLGDRYQRRDPEGGFEAVNELGRERGRYLEFQPHEYIQVWTLEEFATDEATLGLLGPVSDVGRYGLTLVNSLFVDPLYPGAESTAPLELGLVNLNPGRAAIPVGARIGKVAFFDISDSGPMVVRPEMDIARKFAERRSASDAD